jgi:hypothetical protein
MEPAEPANSPNAAPAQLVVAAAVGAPQPTATPAPSPSASAVGTLAATPQTNETAAPPRPVPAQPPYSSPWMLRSLLAGNAVRLDNSAAFYNDKGNSGISNVTLISAGYRPWRNLQLSFKTGFVGNQPSAGVGGFAFLNGVVGAHYATKLPRGWYITPGFSLALPWGMGAGDNPNAAVSAAIKSGGLNRQVLEGAIFGVNFLTLNPGVTLGWVGYGLTVQADAQLFESFRVRASDATDPDRQKTNFWGGVHIGYFFVRQLSIGAELHYQRYLTDVSAVKKDPAARDALSVTAGLRGHFTRASDIIRPGISYSRGIIGQEVAAQYNVVQVELVVAFR